MVSMCVRVCAAEGERLHTARLTRAHLLLLTWLGGVRLAPLGPDAVVPARAGVLDEAAQVAEELGEGHGAGLVDGVVEQGSAPQRGVLPVQHAVDAGQALLRGVQGLQAELLPAQAGAPGLLAVVDPPEVVCAWERTANTWHITMRGKYQTA